MVSEFFLKWLLGIVTGILTSALVFSRKKIKDFFNYETRKKKKQLLKGVNREIKEIEEEIQHKDDEVTQILKDFKKEFMSILEPMRAALLSSHYEALLAKCKKYIQAGEITFDELELLERDYGTYSALGGNGHMEAWMIRIRQLKIV